MKNITRRITASLFAIGARFTQSAQMLHAQSLSPNAIVSPWPSSGLWWEIPYFGRVYAV